MKRNSYDKWSLRGKDSYKGSKFSKVGEEYLEESLESKVMHNLKKPSELCEDYLGKQEEPKEVNLMERALKRAFKSEKSVAPKPSSDLFSELKKRDTIKKGKVESLKDFERVDKEDEEAKKEFSRKMLDFIKGVDNQKLKEVESLEKGKVDDQNKALLQAMDGKGPLNGVEDGEDDFEFEVFRRSSDEEECTCGEEGCEACEDREELEEKFIKFSGPKVRVTQPSLKVGPITIKRKKGGGVEVKNNFVSGMKKKIKKMAKAMGQDTKPKKKKKVSAPPKPKKRNAIPSFTKFKQEKDERLKEIKDGIDEIVDYLSKESYQEEKVVVESYAKDLTKYLK